MEKKKKKKKRRAIDYKGGEARGKGGRKCVRKVGVEKGLLVKEH